MCCCSLKTEIENFQGAERPSFFVSYELQTVRIESMNPIESPTAFWKNMNKVSYQTSREINRSFFSEAPQNLLYDGLFLFRLLQAFLRLQLPTLCLAGLFMVICGLLYGRDSEIKF